MTKKEFEKYAEEYKKAGEEWDNSVEGISYELAVWGDESVEGQRIKSIIVKTLLKLPIKIREKVLDEVIFVLVWWVGLTYEGLFVKTLKKKDIEERNVFNDCISIKIGQSFIFLNFSKRIPESKKIDTIAHEIAHFVLGHHKRLIHMGMKSSKSKSEKEADDLIVKWGFKRCYKTYKIKKK